MSRTSLMILALVAGLGLAAGLLFIARPANALGGALTQLASASTTCTDAATVIAVGDGYSSLYCENNSTTSVFYGGTTVTTANAPCVSTTSASCLRSSFSLDVKNGVAYCRVASGTQAIKCIGGK